MNHNEPSLFNTHSIGGLVPPADPRVSPEQAPKLSTDSARVLDMLRRGPVGPKDCPFTMRLAARIHDLRSAGYAIKSRRGAGHTAVYELDRSAQ